MTPEKFLTTPSGSFRLPVFLPDATYGVVRSVDANDLSQCQVEALVMNTFHLMQRPGSSTIRSLGGLHRMCGWEKPIITDSGGFQVYSLIRENPRNGQISEKGILYHPQGAQGKVLLTPEKTIQLQLSYGADLLICLDDCTHPDDDLTRQRDSVRRTITWAKRCRAEFDRLTANKKESPEKLPRLFAVIQGGKSHALRQECTEALLEMGFDGFGYGGWPLDNENNLLEDLFAYLRELVPTEYPLHALGVGHPRNLVRAYQLGWELFDSALPTRDARHGRLYRYEGLADRPPAQWTGDWITTLHIEDEKYVKSTRPISDECDCLCCRAYSLGYLHHLYKIKDGLYFRLATLHNLRCMTYLTQKLRGA